jgi:Dolichyl-phosphate-mannose-protein mannosyltransferase
MDEGHMLYFADLVAKGGTLYRDATSYPLPGAFYLLAALFRLFGPSMLLARWVVLLEFSLFTALVYLWLRRIVPPAGALAGVALLWLYRVWAFPHWQMYNYSSTAMGVLTASALLLLSALASGRRGRLALSGLVYGLGVFCKQDYGAAFLLASLASLAVATRSDPARPALAPRLAAFLGPAAAVGAAAGLHFWWQGQLGLVVQLTVLNHFVGLSHYAYEAFPPLWPLFAQDPALRAPAGLHAFFPSIVEMVHGLEVRRSAWFTGTALYDVAIKAYIYAPHGLVAGGAVRLVRRRAALRDPARRARALAELVLFAVAASLDLLGALYRPQDYVHLAILYWPFLALGVVYVHALLAGRPRRQRAFALALGPPAALAVAYSLWLAASLPAIYDSEIPLERARGIYVKPAEARLLADVTAYVQQRTRPGETVAVLPYFPILHFLAERPGPHAASYILWPFPEYPDRDRRVVDAMERLHTPLVIWNFTQFPQFPPVSEYAPGIWSYLVDHFAIDRVFSYEAFGYSLAGLVPAPPPAGRALDAGAARVLLQRPGGPPRATPARQRDAFLRREVWPFRRVWALRPTPRGTLASLRLDALPPGTHLRTAVGVHPKLWFRYPPTRIDYWIAVEADGRQQIAFSRTLNPHLVLEDRGWFDVDVDLSAWSGRPLEIRLGTRLEGSVLPAEEAFLMGGWAEPRLTAAEGRP